MILTFHFIILKRVNKYGIFSNNKNTYKLSQNKFHHSSKQCCLFKGVNIYFNAYIIAFDLNLLAVYDCSIR